MYSSSAKGYAAGVARQMNALYSSGVTSLNDSQIYSALTTASHIMGYGASRAPQVGAVYSVTDAHGRHSETRHEGFVSDRYAMKPMVLHQDVHTSLLARSRPMTQFVGDAAVVQEFVEEAFEKLVGESFPKNLRIVVGGERDIRQHHSGAWSAGILGFSLNRQGFGMNEIFVKSNNLDVLMLTIGHEIGHVMSPTLPSIHDEEAKAFAFELAWVETLIEHNIAGLSECFLPAPANNGLHDTAFAFVRDLLDRGADAMKIFIDLVWGRTSMTNTLEWRVNDNG